MLKVLEMAARERDKQRTTNETRTRDEKTKQIDFIAQGKLTQFST
jgi:hypothetical protein